MDIELVIKIDEKDYKIMKHNIAVNNPLCPLSQEEMVSKIANGTPLPKGHGRLIDEDTLPIDEVRESFYNYETGEALNSPVEVVYWDNIKDAHTIIEADKAGRKEA